MALSNASAPGVAQQPPHASTNLILSVPINPASLSPLVTSSSVTHLQPLPYLPPSTGDKTGAMEQEKGEPCITPIASQLSPQENFGLKVLVSQQTAPFPPKPTVKCSSPHLAACFPKGQEDLKRKHLSASVSERGDPGESSRLFTSLKSSLKTLTLLHMVFTTSIREQSQV